VFAECEISERLGAKASLLKKSVEKKNGFDRIFAYFLTKKRG
jgi:hypothetical protein